MELGRRLKAGWGDGWHPRGSRAREQVLPGRARQCLTGPLPCELCQQQTALNPLSADTQPSLADPIYFLGWLPAPSSHERLPALHDASPTPTGEAGSQRKMG